MADAAILADALPGSSLGRIRSPLAATVRLAALVATAAAAFAGIGPAFTAALVAPALPPALPSAIPAAVALRLSHRNRGEGQVRPRKERHDRNNHGRQKYSSEQMPHEVLLSSAAGKTIPPALAQKEQTPFQPVFSIMLRNHLKSMDFKCKTKCAIHRRVTSFAQGWTFPFQMKGGTVRLERFFQRATA